MNTVVEVVECISTKPIPHSRAAKPQSERLGVRVRNAAQRTEKQRTAMNADNDCHLLRTICTQDSNVYFALEQMIVSSIDTAQKTRFQKTRA